MTTRRKEKISRKIRSREELRDIIRRRSLGQAAVDNGRWFLNPSSNSPTRREKKKLEKLEKMIKWK